MRCHCYTVSCMKYQILITVSCLILTVLYYEHKLRNYNELNEIHDEEIRWVDMFDEDGIKTDDSKMIEFIYPEKYFNHFTPKETLTQKPPRYLKDFKNPCWLESSKLKSHCQFTSCPLEVVVSSKLRCLPRVFLAGFPKCGTTDLAKNLVIHQDIDYAYKEPHFWTKHRYDRQYDITRYSKKSASHHMIEHCFDRKGDTDCMRKIQLLDASASTIWFNKYYSQYQNENVSTEFKTHPKIIVAHHIHHILPMSKIIVIMRDPVESHYSARLYFGRISNQSSFHNLVMEDLKEFSRCLQTFMNMRHCIYSRVTSITTRLYVYYLIDWFKIHGRENIHVLRLEDYSQNKRYHIEKILKFLDLETLPESVWEKIDKKDNQNQRSEKNKKLGPMFNKTRDILRSFFRPYNQKLAHLLRDDAYLWDY